MGISSLGVGSSILTQDVLDQLKAADYSQFIAPKDSRISTEKSKSGALDILKALMNNVYQSMQTLTDTAIFDKRAATSSNTSVATISAQDSSDVQAFSLEVFNLATKQIEQSGDFGAETTPIATGSGQLQLSVGTSNYTFTYDASTTLSDLKDKINTEAGASVDATIVQVGTNQFRLMLSAAQTGTGQNISITDLGDGVGGFTLSTALTSGMTNVQTAVDASFNFNGLPITRTSNVVDDLLSSVTITLAGAGTTEMSVKQDRENIASKINNFVEKYNSAIYQLAADTKSSENESERGIFSSDSTLKGMKRSIENILNTVGGGVGKLQDYGIEVGSDGTLSLNASTLNTKLDENPDNVKSFFIGGSFTKSNGSIVTVDGAFNELNDEYAKFSKYGAILDNYKTAMQDRINALNDQRTQAMERLNARYETLAKRWQAYDTMISKINSASSMFVQLANAMTAAQNNLK